MKKLSKEYKNNRRSNATEEQTNDNVALPSRKVTHQKPLSFLEKPIFSLIVFILFILILGGIFFYYNYNKNQDSQQDNKETITISNHQSGNTEPNTSIPNLPMVENLEAKNETEITEVVEPENTDEIENSDEPENSTEQKVPNNQPQNIKHKVEQGDSLYGIARKYYGSTDPSILNKIKEANNLKDNNIFINMELILPDASKNP